jgi:hypothetical protein
MQEAEAGMPVSYADMEILLLTLIAIVPVIMIWTMDQTGFGMMDLGSGE